ncbi:MAG: hypothetical protein GX433_05250 [Deltaproteobacteria bacterium]|nr:hypothetical protein [Deltaproteobacteria bacterium]
MQTKEDEKVCGMCGEREFFTTCSGCGIPLCRKCARLELHGHGCGTVMILYYCRTCVQDPYMNPNAMLREPEK